MKNRDFSDTIKLEVIKSNLARNKGEIHCESCGKKLLSIGDCHFDHIAPYAKGGQSTLANCQILCVECNLRKTDKALQDFILEEKARRFFAGEPFKEAAAVPVEEKPLDGQKMTKERFDRVVGDFIRKNGDIRKVDFGRAYHHLPSVHYVHQFYGDFKTLKAAFGVEDLSLTWDRETIRSALTGFLTEHGAILQKDLTKANQLPSLPCILNYYPECKNFTDIKRMVCRLDVPERWTAENATEAGKNFVRTNGKITQKDLCAANHLPTAAIINRLFGTLGAYQDAVGSKKTERHAYISKEALSEAVAVCFGGKDRVTESQKVFFETFPYSPSTVGKRYGSFEAFCKEQGITVIHSKKARYTKREVDDAVSKWVKAGNPIPAAKDLRQNGLPSISVLLKYYEDWKDPFRLYEKLFEEAQRT